MLKDMVTTSHQPCSQEPVLMLQRDREQQKARVSLHLRDTYNKHIAHKPNKCLVKEKVFGNRVVGLSDQALDASRAISKVGF